MAERPPNLREKLAAALLQLLDAQGNGIPYEQARLLSADEVIALFQCHHEVKRANGGDNSPTNLTMMLYAAHRWRTAKIDVPEISKGKRLREREALHHAIIRAKILGAPPPRQRPSPWPQGRKLPKGGKLRSRNNLRKKVDA